MKLKHLLTLSALFLSFNGQASWVSSFNQWTSLGIGSGYTQSGNGIPYITRSSSLVMLRKNYGQIPFYNVVASLRNEQIIQNNENILELVKSEIDFSRNENNYQASPSAIKELTQDQVTEVYNAMRFHPNVRDQRKYGGRGVGFCFGRALIVHNEALARNVHPNALRKIWVVGDMGFWGHHVATIAKTKGDWTVIDNYSGVMNVENWIKRMKQEKKGSKDLMFFITRAGRFSHQTNNLYNSIDLFNIPRYSLLRYESDGAREALKARDFYKGFFMDYYNYLEQEIPNITRFTQQTETIVEEI